MYMTSSEVHLLRARIAPDSELAIGEYLKAIEAAVNELKVASPPSRDVRSR